MDQVENYFILYLDWRFLVVEETVDGESEGLSQDLFILILDIREVVKHPASSGSQVTMRRTEIGNRLELYNIRNHVIYT